MDPLGLFKLEKLTIEALAAREPGSPAPEVEPFRAMFNPTSLSQAYSTVFDQRPSLGSQGCRAEFVRSDPTEVSVQLVIDGTNVSDYGAENLLGFGTSSVAKQIEHFLKVCYDKHEDTHQCNYLRVRWGQGPIGQFECRLKSVNIQYTSFDRDGSPLRAQLDATFTEDVDPEKKAKAERVNSADVTRAHVVVAGDSLPLLCKRIYGVADHYLAVARHNHLDDFRNLQPGRELVFPPMDQLPP